MRRLICTAALAAPLLLIAGCHSQSDTSTITNSTIDNTVGTASDEMTNIDAATGSATNMAADVPASATPDTQEPDPNAGDGAAKPVALPHAKKPAADPAQ